MCAVPYPEKNMATPIQRERDKYKYSNPFSNRIGNTLVSHNANKKFDELFIKF